MDTTSDTPTPPPPAPEPRRLTRSTRDRMIGGVSGGIGRYFGIDPTLVRIGFVALALIGGTGLIVYAAALLLVPLDEEGAAASTSPRDRVLAISIAVGLIIAGLIFGSFGFVFGGALVPLGFLVLVGVAVWWLASGERPSGSPGDFARRAALGLGLLLACGARWLVLPALAIALPLAFVSAANIDLDGGFGDRRERPVTIGELERTY